MPYHCCSPCCQSDICSPITWASSHLSHFVWGATSEVPTLCQNASSVPERHWFTRSNVCGPQFPQRRCIFRNAGRLTGGNHNAIGAVVVWCLSPVFRNSPLFQSYLYANICPGFASVVMFTYTFLCGTRISDSSLGLNFPLYSLYSLFDYFYLVGLWRCF